MAVPTASAPARLPARPDYRTATQQMSESNNKRPLYTAHRTLDSSSSSSPSRPLQSPPPAAAPVGGYSRNDSIAQRGLLDESAPSSPSPRASYTSAPKVLRDSYQSSQSSTPISQPALAHVNDPEKRGSYPAVSHTARSHHSRDTARGSDGADHLKLNENALRILLYLSGPCFVISLAVLLWTVFSLLIALVIAPFRLLGSKKPFREQIIDFLAPPLRLQLTLISSSVRSDTYGSYNAPLLVIIHLFSPVVSLGVAISSWVSAVFWFYAAIIGDPDGSDRARSAYGKVHNDGRASVLAVRAWWRKWLIRGLR